MKHTILCLLFAIMSLTAFAQTDTFSEGDTVQTSDGRTGKIESFKGNDLVKVKFGENDSQYFALIKIKKVRPPKPQRTEPLETFHVGDIVVNKANQQVRIDSISGDSAVVRYGNGKYNVNTVKLDEIMSLKAWELRRDQETEQKTLRAGFADDAKPFAQTVYMLAPAFDSKYVMDTGFQPVPATYAKMLKDLEGLAVVCQKYPNLINPTPESYEVNNPNIRRNPADWCKMAEQRAEVVRKIKVVVGGQSAKVTIDRWVYKINEAMRDRDGYVKDDLQMLLYDRAAWETKELQSLQKEYATLGEKIPPQLLASLEEKVKEFKAQIEQDAPTRSWKQPEYTDAAFEAIVRKAYPASFPGVKVFKTGMTYATWKAEDDTSLVGSGTGYKVYRTTKGAYRYKLGLALVKLPNQPFCQIRDFEFHQNKAGAGYSAAKLYLPLGNTGIFVKCP